jgi:hypothetical protein
VQLTEVSKVDENKKERKLKTLQLPLFPTERFAMIYRGDASTAGLDRVHFSSVKGLPKLSGDAETFLSKYQDLPPKGPVEGIRARFDKHVFSEKAASDFETRIKLKVRSYLNNLFKEEFPSSQISLNVKDKTMQDITGGLFETYVSGLSQIPIAGKNETFDIKDARIQVSEINKVLYPKLQTGLADIKSSGGDNNITSMINKIFNYEVAHGGDKAIDTARIGLAPGEVLAPPLSTSQSLVRQIEDRYKKLGLPVPQGFRKLFKAEGGLIDSVPALLTPGEFVINRDSAARIGLPELNRMNITGHTSGGQIQKFARGGPVQKFAFGDEVQYGRGLQGRQVIPSNTENDLELEVAREKAIIERQRRLVQEAQTREGLGTAGPATQGSKLRQIQDELVSQFEAGGVDKNQARRLAIAQAEIARQIELEDQARKEILQDTVAIAKFTRDASNQVKRSFEFRNREEVERGQLAFGQQGRFAGFARTDAEREINNRGGAARLSGTSIEAINLGAQQKLAQELVQSEIARIKSQKLGIAQDEVERIARENVTNALLLERKVIVDGNTNKRKLADSENLATAKNLELARETERLTEDEYKIRAKNVAGGIAGVQGDIKPGIGARLSNFLTNPGALAGIAYSATAYAPGLINQYNGGSFEERLPGQVGPRGEVRGDLRETGVAAFGAVGTGLGTGFGAAALSSTLATAGVIGAAAVPPIAIVAGVVSGLLTFTQSLHEQEKQIRSAQLGKALDSLALKINDFNSGKLFGGEAGFGVVGREFQNTERLRRADDVTSRTSLFGLYTSTDPRVVQSTEEKSLREKVLPQLPGLLQAQEKVLGDIFNRQNAGNLRGGVSLNPNELKGQVESVLGDFLKAGDGFGKQILETTARLKNVPYAEVERETKQQIIAIQNSARVVTTELQARSLLSSQLNSLVTFTNSLNGAIISLKEFDDKLSLTGQIVSGNVTGGQVNVRGDVTQAVQSADRPTLDKVLTQSLGILGNRLDTLREPVIQLNRAYRELPGVLSQLGSRPQGPNSVGTPGSFIADILGDKGGFGREIITSITNALDTQFKDPAALQQALRTDIGGLTKELLRSYQPLIETLSNISKSVETETNKFITALSQSSRFLEEVNAGLQQQANLQLQRARVVAETQAIQAGRRGDTGAFLSLQQLEAPFNALQQRLSGINGPAAFNPDIISQKLDKTNEELRKADEERRDFVGTPRGNVGAENFEKLAFESNNLQKSLKNLADVSSRAAGVQEKLTQLQSDRESRLSFGERAITADPAQQAQIQRGLALINITAQRRSAEGLTQPDLRLLFETIHSLGQTRLPVAGNVTAETFGKDLVERIGTSIFPKGVFTPQIGAQNEETQLRKTLTEYFDTGIKSNEKLVQQQSKGYDKFISDLRQSHNIFLTKLEEIELSTLKSNLEDRKRQSDFEKGLATTQNKAAEDLKSILGKGFADKPENQSNFIDALLKNQDEIRKYLELQSANNNNASKFTQLSGLRKDLDTTNVTGDIKAIKQIGTGRNLYQVDQGDLNNRITDLVTKNATALGVIPKNIPLVAAGAQAKIGNVQDFDLSAVNKEYREALRNLPEIIVNLKELGDVRGQQNIDFNTLEKRIFEALTVGKPELKAPAQAVLKNFPQISPLLSQFQSGEQFVKVGERLDSATDSVKKFDIQIRKINQTLEDSKNKSFVSGLSSNAQQAYGPSFGQPSSNFVRPSFVTGGQGSFFDTLPLGKQAYAPFLGGLASGGIISGSGVSSLARGTDTIPAMLTPGEFVVRREAAQQHLPLLLSINNGNFSGEDVDGISHFQLGGAAGLDKYSSFTEIRRLTALQQRIDLQIRRIKSVTTYSARDRALLGYLEQYKTRVASKLTEVSRPIPYNQYIVNQANRSRFITPEAGYAQQQDLTYQRQREGVRRTPDVTPPVFTQSSIIGGQNLPEFLTGKSLPREAPVSIGQSSFGNFFRDISQNPEIQSESLKLDRSVISPDPLKLKPLPVYSDESVRLKPLPLSIEDNYQRGRSEREDRIKKLYGYALGGFVGTTDTVPAMLTPGEYVLNRATTAKIGVNNLNKVNYMQTGGVVTGGANAGGSLLSPDAIASISNFSGAATGLSRALTTFNGNSEGLTSALKAFPKTITGTFTHNVNVNHNGLEILNTLTPSISEIALRTVNRILGNYIRQNLPGAPPLNEENP